MNVTTVTRVGLECTIAQVSVDAADGAGWELDFMPDAAKRETKVRVRSALEYTGEDPGKDWAFKLTSGPLRQGLVHLDLPLAVALLARLMDVSIPEGWAFAGELSLGGDLRPIRGAAPMARALKAAGYKCFVVPEENAAEVEATGFPAWGVPSLEHVKRLLLDPPMHEGAIPQDTEPRYACDFSEVMLNPDDEWPFAVEVALAGGHSLLLLGAPGSGKTMIARRMHTCLTLDESTRNEATDIYSSVGLLNGPVLATAPFRAPHHTISEVGLTGSSTSAMPGEAALAHGGILFLDEAPEFRRNVQEAVYYAHKRKHVQLANNVRYPSDFMLVGSAHNCPCGALGTDRHCSCTSDMRDRYMARLEEYGFDISVPVHQTPLKDIHNAQHCESSRAIRERVMAARKRQVERQGCLNGHLLKPLGPNADFHKLGLDFQTSKLLTIARTIADLHQPYGVADEASDEITMEHIDMARRLIYA